MLRSDSIKKCWWIFLAPGALVQPCDWGTLCSSEAEGNWILVRGPRFPLSTMAGWSPCMQVHPPRWLHQFCTSRGWSSRCLCVWWRGQRGSFYRPRFPPSSCAVQLFGCDVPALHSSCSCAVKTQRSDLFGTAVPAIQGLNISLSLSSCQRMREQRRVWPRARPSPV